MKKHLILSAAVLALAACGSSGTGGNGSGGAGGGGISLQPGEWEMKSEVVSITAEGLPAGMTEGMKANAGSTTRTCMTPEDAKGPKGDMFAGDKSGNCKSEGFNWSGGSIKGKVTCNPNGPGKTVMEMDGSYGAQNIDMKMKSETDLGGKPMKMEMRVSGHRVGECSAATKKG
jgi:hypothetical protein